MQFFKSVAAQRPVCVHANTAFNDPEVWCGQAIFRRFHGWLCLGHFREEQYRIPQPARKPWEAYKGYVPNLSDDQLVSSIIQQDSAAIRAAREAGDIVRYRFGSLDPVYLQVQNVA